MNILTAMRERLDHLESFAELDVIAAELPLSASGLSDVSVIEALRDLAGIANDAARMQSVLAGVAANRSRREDGHSGLAATHGHSTPAALVQAITGGSRADAQRQVRIGQSLLETPPVADRDEVEDAATTPPWHEPLRRALLDGQITAPQHDAIRSGLGQPIVEGVDDDIAAQAWSVAAEGLIDEVSGLTVEELMARARAIRDALDPTGAEDRHAKRWENRSLRMWIDEHGQHRGRITLCLDTRLRRYSTTNSEMALWIHSIRASALRPRRGGPRFMTDQERAQAAELSDDPRTNEQLEYDLFMDLVRAGALAAAEDVFGARQPGVRMVVVKDAVGPRDAIGRLLAVGNAEDGGQSLPGSVIDRALCMNGSVDITVDTHGNPLDVGREQRLFTAKQRIALAVRDGGCLWPGCPRPASYTEAHHIDHYAEDHGHTDIDRGVLLCLFHHLLLHNRGWKIVREGKGPFVLQPPDRGEGIVLRAKAPWKWAWDPPPPPARGGWRTESQRCGPVDGAA